MTVDAKTDGARAAGDDEGGEVDNPIALALVKVRGSHRLLAALAGGKEVDAFCRKGSDIVAILRSAAVLIDGEIARVLAEGEPDDGEAEE